MKDYNEVAKNVFERRDSYYNKKKQNKKKSIRYGVPILSIILVTICSFGFGLYPREKDMVNSITSLPSQTTHQDSHENSSAASSSSDSETLNIPNTSQQQSDSNTNTSSLIEDNTNNDSSESNVIWIPNLPDLEKENLNGEIPNDVPEEAAYHPYFNNFSDFEKWIITGEYNNANYNHEKYLEKWVYMWRNADYTLKTGYYYKPMLTQNSYLEFKYIGSYILENFYRFTYHYKIIAETPVDDSTVNMLTLFVGDNEFSQNEFQKDYNDAMSSTPSYTYSIEEYNNITYHVFIGKNTYENTRFIGIYWQQDDTWYYGYYRTADEDVSNYKNILQNLNMVKTPFRDDLK